MLTADPQPTRRPRPWLIVVVGILVWLAIDRAVWMFRAPLPLSTRALSGSLEQITFDSGIEALPSLSPDGEWVAYRSDVEGTGDIFVRRIGDGEALNLTRALNGEESDPAFSPDGRQIAFRSTSRGGGIFIVARSGGDAQRITNFGASPAWIPNGRAIVFATRSSIDPRNGVSAGDSYLPSGVRAGASEGWIVDIESRSVARLVRTDFRQPAISPDGRRIAYWAAPPPPAASNFARRRETGLWTVAIDGSDARQVAAGGSSGLDWNPVWSSDGEFLYFLSDRGGRVGIWRAAMYRGGTSSVGQAVAMELDAGRAASLAVSADGRRLAWSTAEWSPSIMRIDYDPDARTARGNPVPVRAGALSFRCAEPSPDGALLAAAADQPQSDLYVVSTSGGPPKAITQDGAYESCPRWSPDGTMIAFHTNADGANRIWVARADGTVLHRSRAADEQSYPVWAPNSRSVAAVNQQRSEIDFYNVAPDGGLTKREGLADMPRGFVPTGWSPDGSQIAGTAAGALWFYQVASRTFDRLMPGSQPTWLSRGRRLIFASEGRLILLDVPSRYMREILAVPDVYLDSPILSADDRQLYFSRNVPESNLWLATLR